MVDVAWWGGCTTFPAMTHTARVDVSPFTRPAESPPNALLAALLLSVAALVAASVLWVQRTDPARATALARRELQLVLDPGETPQHGTEAAARHWWDFWRPTYGVLVATDRRLLFVGVTPHLYTDASAPPSFEIRGFPYDTTFAIHLRPGVLGRGEVVASQRETTATFTVASRDEHTRAVVATAHGYDYALRERLRREERFRDSLAALPPLREYHMVRSGDALEALARTYGTTPDQIRELNGLAGDRIRIGQTLLVKVTPRPIPPCPAQICDVPVSVGGEVVP